MEKTDKLLNDLYKYPVSFRNIQKKLKGVVLDDEMFIDDEDMMNFIYYRFNGFVRREVNNDVTWEIDVIVTSQEDSEKVYDIRNSNQNLIKKKLFILLMGVSNLDKVMMKINQF